MSPSSPTLRLAAALLWLCPGIGAGDVPPAAEPTLVETLAADGELAGEAAPRPAEDLLALDDDEALDDADQTLSTREAFERALAWSAEGDHLFFLSDRGGAPGLWRVAIDERSGAVRGAPKPVSLGT